MKRLISIVLTIMMMVGIVAGCGGTTDETTAAPTTAGGGEETTAPADGGDEEDIVLRMWFGREDFIPGDKFAKFEADNPGIKVEYDVIPLEQAAADFLRNHAAGNAPDIFQIFHQYTPTLVAQNSVLDMTPYFDQWKTEDPDFYNAIVPIAFEIGGWEGKPYGLGIHVAPYFMAYRLDQFNEAGLSEAKTWEDVVEAGKTLRDEVLEPGQYAFATAGGTSQPPFWFSSVFMSMGGQYKDTGLPIMNDEAGIATIEFYQTLVREELANPEILSWASGDFRGAFISGNASMFPEATNIYPNVQAEMEYGVEWECQVQPYREGAEDTFRVNSFGWPYMVNSDTEHPEAVAAVLKYLMSDDIVKEVVFRYQPTTNLNVMSSAEFKAEQPWFEKVEAAFEVMDMIPGHVRQQEVNDAVNGAKQEAIMSPNADPKEIADKWQAVLDALDA